MSRPFAELDIENLVDYFLIGITDKERDIRWEFQLYPGSGPMDIQALVNLLSYYTIVTFNGTGYDVPILTLALYGADNKTLKEAGDKIIVERMAYWQFYTHYQVEPPEYLDHVDVMEVAAGVRIGLKMYGGRMHAPLMQDLPVPFDVPIPPSMYPPIRHYCGNDRELTWMMRVGLKDRLALRVAIGLRYNIDVRSKSDAQIAEAVIKAQLPFRPTKRYISHGYTFKYEPPTYIRFATPQLQALLQTVRDAEFLVSDKEEAIMLGYEDVTRTGVVIPPELSGRSIQIGTGTYRIGIGGLHSQESNVSHYARGGKKIKDIDVKSYYPSMILGMGMYPEQLGEDFLRIYRAVYDTRLRAKSEADRIRALWEGIGAAELKQEADDYQTESDGLKIVLNGTFGKLFSKYSILYAPEFGIATTMTGQLLLLMLIEMMELTGIRVVSANTDGIVLKMDDNQEELARSNVAWWERVTGLEMEESEYSSIHFRDVNNYVAITTKGKVKRKGIFRESGLIENKHPDKDICAEAIVVHLKTGASIEQTITNCTDIKKFLTVRNAAGGANYIASPDATPEFLGKAVRWYYGANAKNAWVSDAKSGNKVAGSDGAVPIMRLPETFPTDVDYQHYITIANKMLTEIGVTA